MLVARRDLEGTRSLRLQLMIDSRESTAFYPSALRCAIFSLLRVELRLPLSSYPSSFSICCLTCSNPYTMKVIAALLATLSLASAFAPISVNNRASTQVNALFDDVRSLPDSTKSHASIPSRLMNHLDLSPTVVSLSLRSLPP